MGLILKTFVNNNLELIYRTSGVCFDFAEKYPERRALELTKNKKSELKLCVYTYDDEFGHYDVEI